MRTYYNDYREFTSEQIACLLGMPFPLLFFLNKNLIFDLALGFFCCTYTDKTSLPIHCSVNFVEWYVYPDNKKKAT